jgi:ABC-type nitrate/sulfonate/bicarbonate transport system substrate-binding protein
VFSLHSAIGEGYFGDEGLNVTVQAVDGSSQVLQAMAACQAQIDLPGPGPVAIGDGGMAATAFLRDDVESYAAAVSDAANLESRGITLRETTPEEYLSYFGNGYAALRTYIEGNPDVIEGFGRALVRGVEFSMDPANKDQVLEYARQGNRRRARIPPSPRRSTRRSRTA